MGLVFLYRQDGEWWLRRKAPGSFTTVELAGVPGDCSASEAYSLVQRRSLTDKVVVESAHDDRLGEDDERYAG